MNEAIGDQGCQTKLGLEVTSIVVDPSKLRYYFKINWQYKFKLVDYTDTSSQSIYTSS